MSEIVRLKGGPIVTVEARNLAIDLELRGYRLIADNGRLRVTPPGLSDTDDQAIRRWKWHLLAIAAYQPPTGA